MRLDINLASHPYEDARQFWLRWGTALGVASILTLVLVTITITGWFNARRDHAKIADFRAQIAQRDRTRQQAEDFLNRPENRTTRDQSQFLNQLIERKSLSWTYVLEDLEKVMPARVHLVSIHPELDEENQLTLKMASWRATPAIGRSIWSAAWKNRGTLRRPISRRNIRRSRGVEIRLQFNIDGVYVPDITPVAAPAPTPKTATPTKTVTPTAKTVEQTSKGSKP